MATARENEANIEVTTMNGDVQDNVEDVSHHSSNYDIQCGPGCGNWKAIQKLANQTTFVVIYGFTGCVMSMTYAYFNGTITTLEKRFQFSSKSIGITQLGGDFTQMMTSLIFIHFISKKHRPRWIAAGIFMFSLFCLLTTMPHWLYGPGEDALKLTNEFADSDDDMTKFRVSGVENTKNLCHINATVDPCQSLKALEKPGHPMLIFFLAQILSGFGWSVYYTLGYAYMDDNVEKSKTAAMYSFSTFLNMLGPSCGYNIAALCLRQYISPTLTPSITQNDSRWIGAWWMGWLLFAGLLFVSAFFLGLFPKELPAFYRRKLQQNGPQSENLLKNEEETEEHESTKDESKKSSLHELLKTFKRLLTNKIFMCNTFASLFYFFGFMPYMIFTPKYLEIVFRLSAAESNFYEGTVALVFTSIGVLSSGAIISRKKPRARVLAGWNAIAGLLTVAGYFSYSLISCPENENSLFMTQAKSAVNNNNCTSDCHCEFVPYEPVCGENNLTYISACHAGCKGLRYTENEEKIFYDCACIGTTNVTHKIADLSPGLAIPGACPSDCFQHFLVFLVLMCCLKLVGSSTRASSFLIQVRSVAVEDKTVALAIGSVLLSLLALAPSPIFFGWIYDSMCLVWGKTCSEKSNCWLYDSKRLKYALNCTASVFLAMGTLCDCLNCFWVKDLKIFDENDEKKIENEKISSNMELAKLTGAI